jgi:hypothetical protein
MNVGGGNNSIASTRFPKTSSRNANTIIRLLLAEYQTVLGPVRQLLGHLERWTNHGFCCLEVEDPDRPTGQRVLVPGRSASQEEDQDEASENEVMLTSFNATNVSKRAG